MGKNLVRETFTSTTTWTAPGGVTSIRARARNTRRALGAMGGGSNFIIQPDGTCWAWGFNTNGELGDASIVPKSSPVAVVGGVKFIDMFTNPAAFTFGIDQQGQMWAWGQNGQGQLAVGDANARSSPVQVSGAKQFALFHKGISSSSVAYNMGAVDFSGNIWTWGSNANGQLGDNSVTSRSSPVQVTGGLSFSQFGFGGGNSRYALGLTTSGSAYGWGSNNNGNLGDGTTTDRSSPVAVVGGLTFTQIEVGGGSRISGGLTSAGALWLWGDNAQGPLGDGTSTGRSSPVQVLGSHVFSKFKIQGNSVFALDTAGLIWAWGANNKGQLGDNSSTSKSSPVQVLGSNVYTDFWVHASSSVNTMAVFALDTSGNLWAWGDNGQGHLGDNSTTDRSSPVQVSGGKTWVRTFFNYGRTGDTLSNYAVGIDTDGNIWAWGSNVNGNLGDGSVTARSSPIQVLNNKVFDLQSLSTERSISVVPGTTYNVVLNKFFAAFGDTQIAGYCNEIVLEYQA